MKLSNQEIQRRKLDSIANTQQISYSPIAFECGKDALLFDYDGNKYIDFLSSACSANLGYGNKEISEAVKEQMDKITQYSFAYFNTAPPVQYAEKLAEITPGDYEKKVLFSCTGSAGVDSAIKIARAYTGRSKIVTMIGAYHGSTYGAITASALALNMRRKIGPLLPDFYHFHYPDKNHAWQDCIAEMEEAFQHYLAPEEVAAIIIEPMAGDMGLVAPPTEWVQALRGICDKYGILLIDDEIQLALCRTGKWFAIEHFGVEADLYVMGKSVGGGLPLGAVIGRKDILDTLDAPAHVFTLAANTTACISGMKSLEIMQRIDANKQSIEKGEYLKNKFVELKKEFEVIGDIRGYGLSIGVDIIEPESGKLDPKATAKICYEALQRGLVLIFLNGTTLRVQPPLVITTEQMDEAIEILRCILQDLQDGKISDDVLAEIQGW